MEELPLEFQSKFNRAQTECVTEALKFLKGFTEEDLENFVQSVFMKAENEKVPLATALEKMKSEMAEVLKNQSARQFDQYDKLFNPENGLATRS